MGVYRAPGAPVIEQQSHRRPSIRGRILEHRVSFWGGCVGDRMGVSRRCNGRWCAVYLGEHRVALDQDQWRGPGLSANLTLLAAASDDCRRTLGPIGKPGEDLPSTRGSLLARAPSKLRRMPK